MDVQGKRVLVVGFGISGQAAARLLALKGASVLAIDESKEITMKRRARRKKSTLIQTHFGVKTLPSGRFDAAILSPGVDRHRGLAAGLANLDVPIYGELELGSWFCQCPIIAITGTNGKTTTTELVEKAIRANRKRTIAAGNIGLPLSSAALQSEDLDCVVVEVSSFQLETIETFRPSISVMMNITPDHLDRYASFEEYARVKGAVWKNQCGNDIAIVNLDTERHLAELGCSSPVRTVRYSTRGEAADLWVEGGHVCGPIVESAGLKAVLKETRLRGQHNAENIMAALAVIQMMKLDLLKAWEAICDYQPLAHRLETIGVFHGVEFINDSKATNIDAMEKAIRTFTRPVILVAGGKDKGFDFSAVTPLIRERVKACFLIGEMRETMLRAWGEATACTLAESMEEAVQGALAVAAPGDVCLFSPGCSSYDMFEDYEERGDVFRHAVEKLGQFDSKSAV